MSFSKTTCKCSLWCWKKHSSYLELKRKSLLKSSVKWRKQTSSILFLAVPNRPPLSSITSSLMLWARYLTNFLHNFCLPLLKRPQIDLSTMNKKKVWFDLFRSFWVIKRIRFLPKIFLKLFEMWRPLERKHFSRGWLLTKSGKSSRIRWNSISLFRPLSKLINK